jgi:hypothetical protein
MQSTDPPAPNLVPIEEMVGDDEEDTALLRRQAEQAEAYLRSHKWCSTARSAYFGGGIGGIFAVFLCAIDPPPPGDSPWIWVMVGDPPPAYLPLKDARSPAEVFREYIRGMSKWVDLARQRRSAGLEDEVPPVDIPATPEWADKIQQKLHLLLLLVKPYFESSGESGEIN